jgi:hypothetical protein
MSLLNLEALSTVLEVNYATEIAILRGLDEKLI